jgi:hypothetical protein
MNNCLILMHLCTGDNFTYYPIIRHYSEIYKNVFIYCLHRNRNTVMQIYEKISNVVVIYLPENYNNFIIPNQSIENLKNAMVDIDVIKTGIYHPEWNNDKVPKFYRFWYENAGLDYDNVRYKYQLNRNHEGELEVYNKIVETYGENYIFVHDHQNSNYPASNRGSNIIVDTDLPIYHPNCNYYKCDNIHSSLWYDFKIDNILDYSMVIEKAKEIHILDSCFSCLCTYLNLNDVTKKIIYSSSALDVIDYHKSFMLYWKIIKY